MVLTPMLLPRLAGLFACTGMLHSTVPVQLAITLPTCDQIAFYTYHFMHIKTTWHGAYLQIQTLPSMSLAPTSK